MPKALLLLVAVLLLGAALLVKKPDLIDSLPWAVGEPAEPLPGGL